MLLGLDYRGRYVRPIGRLGLVTAPAEGLTGTPLLFGRAVFQGKPEAMVGVLETLMDTLEVGYFIVVDLLQGCLDGLNLQHTVGDGFTF
jgi:hypothetical protein